MHSTSLTYASQNFAASCQIFIAFNDFISFVRKKNNNGNNNKNIKNDDND